MDIGVRIKAIRMSKHMTQSELAGDQITRNMLSLIENGNALPSLPTVTYIAERLGIPMGLLLAGKSEELIYLKLERLPRIKQAFSQREFRLCADMCQAMLDMNPDSCDDELLMIMAECHFGLAVDEFNSGKLHNACRELDEACSYSKQTVYNSEHIRCSAAVYFEYMRRLSPTLSSDSDNDVYSGAAYSVDSFGKYYAVLQAIGRGDIYVAENYVSSAQNEEKGFAEHVRALIEMGKGNYKLAEEILSHLLGSDDLACRAVTYRIFSDLERCCKEIGDYKNAYEYSVGKIELLEYMLKD